jgi:hypothetical protein
MKSLQHKLISENGVRQQFVYTDTHREPIEDNLLNACHIDPEQEYTFLFFEGDTSYFKEIKGHQIVSALHFLDDIQFGKPNYFDLSFQTVRTFRKFKNAKKSKLKNEVITLIIALVFLQKSYADFANQGCIAFEIYLYADEQNHPHLEIFGTPNTDSIQEKLQTVQNPKNPSSKPSQFKREKGTPRPNRFQKTMNHMRQHFSGNIFENVSRCMNDGAIYVIDDLISKVANPEHIVSSLCALSDFDKLHLPHPHIWVEQTTPLKSSNSFGLEEDVYLSVAAYEKTQGIFFNLFVESTKGKGLSTCACKVSFHNGEAILEFEEGKEYVEEHNQPDDFFNAAAGILLNFLFLLNCETAEIKTISHQSPPKRAANSNRSNKKKREYTLIRFSRYVSDKPKVGSKTEGPHRLIVRSAHMWGKNTRPIEQQQWRKATLVRIAANDNEANTVKKPSYRLSRL